MQMPKLIYGTAWKKEKTADFVEQAILSGFRGIDTACQPKHYEEPLVGEALERLSQKGIARDQLFLQTKFTPLNGQDPNRIPYDPNATLDIQVAQSFGVSKKNLRTDYVNSLVLHTPLFPYSNLKLVWEAMENIYKSGEAKQLGISNCYELELLMRLYNDASVKPAVVQNRFYHESSYDVDIRTWCKQHNVAYQGFWTLTANPHLLASQYMMELANKYNKTAAQIFYRFLSHINITPLIGSTSKKHIDEDLHIFEFELTAGEIEILDSMLS